VRNPAAAFRSVSFYLLKHWIISKLRFRTIWLLPRTTWLQVWNLKRCEQDVGHIGKYDQDVGRASKVASCTMPTIEELTSSRTRRVKCDETFPACHRCTSVSRVCEGYGIWGGGGGGAIAPKTVEQSTQSTQSSSPVRIQLAKISTARVLRMIPVIPGPTISTEEKEHLEWFMHGTAKASPKLFSSPFWDPIMFQATMHEPMVLQGLLAFSSAHKRKHVLNFQQEVQVANATRQGMPPDAEEIFFLKQYGLAIKNMQNLLADQRRPKKAQLRLVVVMCSLFTLLEYTRCQYATGMVHLSCGGNLAKQLITSDGADDQKLVHFLARMCDYSTGQQQRPPQDPYTDMTAAISRALARPAVPFASLAEAGYQFELLSDLLALACHRSRVLPLSVLPQREEMRLEHEDMWATFEMFDVALEATFEVFTKRPEHVDVLAWETLRETFLRSKEMLQACLGLYWDT
jgi:hypothetical protein